MGAKAEREKRTRELIRAYPYIWAWGRNMGSFSYYMEAESEEATADGAPSNVIHRRDLAPGRCSQTERDQYLTSEAEGTAWIIRDGDGTPVRAWALVTDIRRPEVRDVVEKYAEEALANLNKR